MLKRAAIVALGCLALVLPAPAQMLVSTGSASGARLYQTNSNDWWIDPSGGRFDLRVNGGATPVMKVDSAGGVTSSSSTLTGTGTATPFALTTSSGVHVLSGKLKLEPGAWIEYGDGTVALSSTSAGGPSTVVANSSISVNLNGINGTQTTFNVAVETLTITASGVNPVMVCYSGPIDIAANGGTGWSFLLDGGYVGSLSSTIGVTFGGIYNNSSGWLHSHLGECYPVPAASLSAGSHKFAFVPMGNGGTWKLGYMNNSSVTEARFYVYELGGSASAGSGGSGTSPTRTILTSGSGATYTTPTGAVQLRVRMVGGGGGGGGAHTSAAAGGAGGNTTFGTVTANGGGGGDTSGIGGYGGSNGSGTASYRVAGSTGARTVSGPASGGSSPFGGAGAGSYNGSDGNGRNAAANSGSGGGSCVWNGGSPPYSGPGGAGEYAELVINNPAGSYSYSVGGAGSAGGGSCSGGTGGSGVIIVDEFYGSGGGGGATLASTQTFSGAQTFASSTSFSAQSTFASSSTFKAAIELGDSISGLRDRAPITVWAKSVDGATQSSGCVVSLGMSANDATGFLTFTSTTTDGVAAPLGVLFDSSCAPSTYCRVAVYGLVRHQCRAGSAVGQSPATFTTRCTSDIFNNTATNGTSGMFVGAADGGGWCWTFLGIK